MTSWLVTEDDPLIWSIIPPRKGRTYCLHLPLVFCIFLFVWVFHLFFLWWSGLVAWFRIPELTSKLEKDGYIYIYLSIYLLTSDVESPTIIIIPTTDPPQKTSTNHDRGHGKMQTHSTILLGPRTQKWCTCGVDMVPGQGICPPAAIQWPDQWV